MNPLYNLGIYGMSLGARIGALRSAKLRRQITGQRETLSRMKASLQRLGRDGFDWWFHAASLGEFEQARPLIEALRARNPKTSILLTFFSPSGYDVRHNYDKADCVAYLPFDKPAAVRAFLDMARPRATVFIKYEFWGNFITELKRRNIPVYLVSAIFRPGQIFFRPWGGDFRRILLSYSKIFIQDEDSKELLNSIGVTDIVVAGDTRLDRVSQIAGGAQPIPEFEQWLADKPFTLVVGSSWQPDEACYLSWLNAHPDVRAIIAPHEFDDQRLAALRSKIDGRVVLWSEVKGCEIPKDVKAVIIDCFGLLSRLYAYGNAAIVGGGLGVGIHNINEAAVYGIPVAFGPNHHKFREATALLENGGGFEYKDADSAAAILDKWYTDAAALQTAGAQARAFIDANVGATQKIMDVIAPIS